MMTSRETVDTQGGQEEGLDFPDGRRAFEAHDEEILLQVKTQKSDHTFKIMSVGDYTGFGKKGGFLLDYIQNRPLSFYHKPTIGVDFYLKFLQCVDSSKKKPKDCVVKLQFWDVAEHERFLNMTPVYCQNCAGALVFWGPKSPSSLSSTLKWSEKIKEGNGGKSSNVPMVLIIENIPSSKRGRPLDWIGHGRMVESREIMDRFCSKHGFIAWFELFSREGEGYTGVMSQAVDVLVGKIFEERGLRISKKEWIASGGMRVTCTCCVTVKITCLIENVPVFEQETSFLSKDIPHKGAFEKIFEGHAKSIYFIFLLSESSDEAVSFL